MFRRARMRRGAVGAGRRRLRAALSASVVAVLAVSGCSSQETDPGPGPRSSTGNSASPEARSLTQRQLEAARLAAGEAAGYQLTLGSEKPADMRASGTVATPKACQPALTVLQHGWAEGAVGYTRLYLGDPKDSVTAREVALTSYPSGRAEEVFSAVATSLRECRSLDFKPVTGDSVHAELSPGKPLAPGDESLRAVMSYEWDGIEHHIVYGLVRSGDVLSYVKVHTSFGKTLPKQRKAALMPVLDEELFSRQVAKVEAALKRASTS